MVSATEFQAVTIAANTASQRHSPLGFVIGNGVIAFVLGGLMVVTPWGPHLAVLALWLVLLVVRCRKEFSRGNRARAAMAVLLQTSVMALVVTAAVLAPGKTAERFLDHMITIPKCRMTLAEIERDEYGSRPQWRPLIVEVLVPEDEKTRVIEFPGRALTLRQFLTALEQQSTLRHRLYHCGNGSTILWGGDCSFGVGVRRPRD